MITMSNRKYGRTGIHGVQTKQELTCRVCSKSYVGHHLSKECDECRHKQCLGPGCENRIPVSNKKRYCSVACREANPGANKMPLANRVTVTCPCGVEFPKYSRTGRHRYCSPECRSIYTKVGDRLRNDPEIARSLGRMAKGVSKGKGYKQSEEHLVKRLGNGAIRASKEELSLAPTLTKLGFQHTGEGAFWRRWDDGTIHNPDFVDRTNRVVLEYFGSYWHAPAEADIAKEQWARLGYRCVVVWDYEREDFLQAPEEWVGS